MTEKLYELTEQYKYIEKALDEADEEFPRDALEVIKTKIEDKAEDIAKLIRSYEADVTGIQSEIERLTKRGKTLQGKIDWLKEYLKQEMIVADIPSIKKGLFTISLRPCPASVNVIDFDAIPVEFRRFIPESWQPDKKLILDYYKEHNQVITGVEIIADKKSLSIR
jgi:predicted ArsR family transcriptional regulator